MTVSPYTVTGDWITAPPTQALCKVLEGAGFQALFVGGCVRNALLGVPVNDIDLTTDATPDKTQALAEDAGFRVVPTGIEHGTITVIAGGIAHEVTTFRRDVETDGRHAVVAFTTRISEDAARRDFTMNALYARSDGSVIDPLGGMADLMARQVRFVGDGETRIQEDALRILRFFRFHAHYGDPAKGIDADGLAASAALCELLDGLSRERIGQEMRKLLSAADPAPAVAAMAAAGVLAHVLPGADPAGLAPLVHVEGAVPPNWQRRLLVLGGALDRLCLSRAELANQAHMRDGIGSMASPAGLGQNVGLDPARDVILARQVLLHQPPPDDWQDEIARGAKARFPVTAADLPDLAGPALGARLKSLRQQWEASNLTAGKDDLLGKPA